MRGRAARVLGASFLIVAALLLGCQSTGDDSPGPDSSPGMEWGPLAIMPPQDGADTARTEGTLIITDACVYLETQGESTLLFWPADRTTWNEQTRAITFLNFDGTSVTVTDGDYVVLGGGGDTERESGISAEEWVEGMAWVAAPDPSCSAEVRWGVGAIQG